MIKYIQVTNTGKGFITHKDQEIKGLGFRFLLSDTIKVNGEEGVILDWVNRVGGIETTEVLALDALALKTKNNKIKRIKELEGELIILKADVK